MESTTTPSDTIYLEPGHAIEHGIFYYHQDGGLRHYHAMARTQQEFMILLHKEDPLFVLSSVVEWYKK
jgi:hypothetical protein